MKQAFESGQSVCCHKAAAAPHDEWISGCKDESPCLMTCIFSGKCEQRVRAMGGWRWEEEG